MNIRRCDTAVYFDWRGEDSGPNVGSAKDVLGLYAILCWISLTSSFYA